MTLLLALLIPHASATERTDVLSSPSDTLTINDYWTGQFFTATEDATLTGVDAQV
jgi:hypothetical protein